MKKKDNVKPEEVKAFIAKVEQTKEYDQQLISEYHDRIFGKNDRSGDSCPIMQMRKIKAWYQDQKKRY